MEKKKAQMHVEKRDKRAELLNQADLKEDEGSNLPFEIPGIDTAPEAEIEEEIPEEIEEEGEKKSKDKQVSLFSF